MGLTRSGGYLRQETASDLRRMPADRWRGHAWRRPRSPSTASGIAAASRSSSARSPASVAPPMIKVWRGDLRQRFPPPRVGLGQLVQHRPGSGETGHVLFDPAAAQRRHRAVDRHPGCHPAADRRSRPGWQRRILQDQTGDQLRVLGGNAGGQVAAEPAADQVDGLGRQLLDEPMEVIDERGRGPTRGPDRNARCQVGRRRRSAGPARTTAPVRHSHVGGGRPEVRQHQHRGPGPVGIDPDVPLVDDQVVDRTESHPGIVSSRGRRHRPTTTATPGVGRGGPATLHGRCGRRPRGAGIVKDCGCAWADGSFTISVIDVRLWMAARGRRGSHGRRGRPFQPRPASTSATWAATAQGRRPHRASRSAAWYLRRPRHGCPAGDPEMPDRADEPACRRARRSAASAGNERRGTSCRPTVSASAAIADSGGQPVTEFDVPAVPQFQRRSHALPRFAEHLDQQAAPSMPGSGIDGGADPVGGGEPSLDCAEHEMRDLTGLLVLTLVQQRNFEPDARAVLNSDGRSLGRGRRVRGSGECESLAGAAPAATPGR